MSGRVVACLVALLIATTAAPTPSFGAVTFSDQFDGSSIDSSKWDASLATSGERWCASVEPDHLSVPGNWQDPATIPCHGLTQVPPYGAVSVAGGEANLSAASGRAFPYVWSGPPSKGSPFPGAGDFSLEVRMKFTSLKSHGSHFSARNWPDSTPTGDNPPGGGPVFGVSGQVTGGVRLNLLGSVSGGLSGPLNWHTYRLEYAAGSYYVYVDGVLRQGPVASAQRPNNLWFGNPVFTDWLSGDWSDLVIDYVNVDTTTTPPPDLLEFGDEFDGSALDPTLWNTSTATGATRWCASVEPNHLGVSGNWQNTSTTACHGFTAPTPYGNIAVSGGSAIFSAGAGRAFPYVWSGLPSRESFFAHPDFPAVGNFSLEVRMRFLSPTSHGSALFVTDWPDSDPVSDNPPAGQTPVWSLIGGGGGTNSTILSSSTVGIASPTAFHTYRLDYANEAYSVSVDNVPKHGPISSSVRPNAIWLGNPVFTHWLSGDWTDFEIDYARISFPHPRPRAAGPLRASLVPAFEECTEPDREHGPGLDYPSCAQPSQLSQHATVGTGDANGKPVKSVGQMRVGVQVGDPDTAPDEADVTLSASIADVRRQSDLEDYTGELQGRLVLRVTDRTNGPGLADPATVEDMPFVFTIPCSGTVDTTVGATCSVTTTADSLTPGTVVETKRSVWQIAQPSVIDGGADGDVDTPGDNTPFAVSGLFIP